MLGKNLELEQAGVCHLIVQSKPHIAQSIENFHPYQNVCIIQYYCTIFVTYFIKSENKYFFNKLFYTTPKLELQYVIKEPLKTSITEQ